MPDGSGYQLCSEIRVTSQVPIIFLTEMRRRTSSRDKNLVRYVHSHFQSKLKYILFWMIKITMD
ncbi:hypothetical protein [Paenibacillus amylolyticus]|uniref:hypothetical protein n=1 Tax=Paenibacillus amylolyticus TaxID=1451 RepID=UPI003183B75E